VSTLLRTAARFAASETEMGRRLSRRAGRWVMNRVRPAPKHEPLRVTALKGLGAAAVALPVGYVIGRMRRE
jgi:hypothetical protein